MSEFVIDNQPKSFAVRATDVHGARVGIRAFFLFGALCGVIGFSTGGLIMPFLRYKPDIQTLHAEDSNFKDALMISIGAQSVLASPSDGNLPVPTDLSVERIISEYEVRASQAGLLTDVELEKGAGKIELRFTFTERDKKQRDVALIGGIAKDFPKTIAMTFTASDEPGSITLSQIRRDGETLSTGAAFVELVKMDGNQPKLSGGQYLTREGVFEIKTTEHGPVAFIDNKPIFPLAVKNANKFSFGGDKDAENAADKYLPKTGNILQLVGIEPNNSAFKDRLLLISSSDGAQPCSSQAVLIDIPRKKTQILNYMLKEPRLYMNNGNKEIILSGFCEKDGEIAKESMKNMRLEASYNLQNGELLYRHKPIAEALPPQAPKLAEQTQVTGNWRTTSPTRIASPISSGSALVSLSCRPGGGVSVSVSGLPAPTDGSGARLTFGGTGTSASAGMHYIATANSYELAEVSRPLETKQVLGVLKGGGNVTISTLGAKTNVAAPGAGAVNSLLSKCDAVPVKSAMNDIQPKTISTPKLP